MTGEVADLNEAERRLCRAVQSGERVSFASAQDSFGAGRSRTIRGEVIREILLGWKTDRLDPRGVVLQGAHVSGYLDLSAVSAQVGLALIDCVLARPVNLCDARLPSLVLKGSHAKGVEADGAKIDGAFIADHLVCNGTIRVIGAVVGGELNLLNANIESGQSAALLADGLDVGGDLLLGGRFRTAKGGRGAVRLVGARIRGDLNCDQAIIEAESGPALKAEYITVDKSVWLRRIRAIGSNGDKDSHGGAVVMYGAYIKGQLSCEEAVLKGGNGCAVGAAGINVEGDVFLSHLQASGSHPDGAIQLCGAHVGGHFICVDADVSSDGGSNVSVDFSFMHIGKALSLHGGLATPGRPDTLKLDGMSYNSVPGGMSRAEWIAVFRDRMQRYATQPYRQLASVYRLAGQDDDARAVLIAQMDDLRNQPATLRPARIRLRLLKVTLGYGYQSWRALVGLILTFICAVAFVLLAGQTTHVVRVIGPPAGQPGTHMPRCGLADQIGLAFDLAVPLVNTTSRQRCNLVAQSGGEEWLVALGWVIQVLGWAFATLFIAGYTGLIRRE